jgi:hypothetical protein
MTSPPHPSSYLVHPSEYANDAVVLGQRDGAVVAEQLLPVPLTSASAEKERKKGKKKRKEDKNEMKKTKS